MGLFTIYGGVVPIVLVVVCSWQSSAATSNGKETFSYGYLDTEQTILKLRCDGGCSTDITVVTIVIYNQTDMTTLCAVRANKAPNVFQPPVSDVSYYAAGGLFDKDNSKSCHLELIITNSNMLRLHFGCNVSHSDMKGTIIQHSTSLAVFRKAIQPGSHNLAPSTNVILIGIIIFLFFLSIFFLSMWLRECCLHRNRLTYQTSSQRKVNSHIYQGDTESVLSCDSSPAIDVKESEVKYQSRSASVRRMNSRSEANVVYPVLPPSPPPPFLRGKNTSQRACSSIKVPYTYARPQDSIEPDFSEDGDVASSIGPTRQLYFQTSQPQDGRQGPVFYSSVAINNPVDL